MSSTLRLRLYRALLQRAQRFDANPAMKGVLKDLDHFEPLQLRTLYSPSMQKSFVQLVRQVFRKPAAPGVTDELGFNVLRYLNEVDAKYYPALYPKAEEGAVSAAPLAAQLSAPISATAPSSVPAAPPAVSKQPLLRRLARAMHRYWAMPIPVPDAPVASPAEEALVPTTTQSGSSGAKPFHPLAPGVVLANHPLSEWPFSKCALLVVEEGPEAVSGLILNYPRVYPVGPNNYIFPPTLRNQSCHVGGPVVSFDMPPIPNYYIIHPFPKIPNTKILLPDDERPVCVSRGEDIAAIGEYIQQRKASPQDFVIFAGSVIIPKVELQRQVQDGFWMPVLASSEFVHSAGRLGRLFWDGLMESCGGEFAHMPLISAMLEQRAAAAVAAVAADTPAVQ